MKSSFPILGCSWIRPRLCPPAFAAFIQYTVAVGDTLEIIAVRFNSTVDGILGK
jgi:hypothetical protein